MSRQKFELGTSIEPTCSDSILLARNSLVHKLIISSDLDWKGEVKCPLTAQLRCFITLYDSIWGSEGEAPRHQVVGWVVSFTPRSLYLRGKSLCCPLNRKLSGLQSRCGRLGKYINPCPCQKSNHDSWGFRPRDGRLLHIASLNNQVFGVDLKSKC